MVKAKDLMSKVNLSAIIHVKIQLYIFSGAVRGMNEVSTCGVASGSGRPAPCAGAARPRLGRLYCVRFVMLTVVLTVSWCSPLVPVSSPGETVITSERR